MKKYTTKLFWSWLLYKIGLKKIYYIDKKIHILPFKKEGDIVYRKMKSGKTGIYKIVEIKRCDNDVLFADPTGILEYVKFEFIGYEGEKPLREMSFNEFLKSTGRENDY